MNARARKPSAGVICAWPARWLSVVLFLTAPVGSLAGEVSAAGRPEVTRVTLHRGYVLRGQIVARDEKQVTLELMTGARMTLDMSTVEEIAVERGVGGPAKGIFQRLHVTRTRYLYGPSAMMLKGGEGYFSQKELLFSSLEVGLTDYLSVRVESALLLPLFGGLNALGTVKVGGSFSEDLHLAGGLQLLAVPALASGWLGVAFGAFTLGSPAANCTLLVGYPFALSSNVSPGFMLVTASGQLRLSPKLGLVTENWIVPRFSSTVAVVNSLALRLILTQRLTIDLGAVYSHDSPYLVPWLDFMYSWG